MAGLLTTSDLLGYTSIACWLGAQFPQILENIKQQSCEGLALPFLANWALGDLSNLIGCILTHQLPFQTLLASYFVFVDFTLLLQYFYYRRKVPPIPHGRPRSRLASGSLRYRTLSVVAANVAAAAALAAQQQDEQVDSRYAKSRISRRRASTDHRSSISHVSRETTVEGDDTVQQDPIPAEMLESFRSERPPSKRVSWSIERHSRRGGSMSGSPILSRNAFIPAFVHVTPTDAIAGGSDALERGRSLQRDASDVVHGLTESPESTRRSSRGASRRGAGMVFLAVGALFGVGTLTRSSIPFSSNDLTPTGRVLYYGKGLPISDPTPAHVTSSVIPMTISTPNVTHNTIKFVNVDDQLPDDDLPDDRPSGERVLGRIFAWLCTTLYLTSRLPQIWKNFARKSVEGLSMYLFIFAFFGNIFYVASILSSPNFSAPPPESTEFIKESIPYLLGSGGTLIFDITIVSQSFIYRPRRHHRGRTGRSGTVVGEEETGLLSGDALEQPPLSSSAVSQHGLVTNESTVQPRYWTLSSPDDP